MKEHLEQYVKQVKERHEFCGGNEQATKLALIAPLFSILGYDMADPRECKPEYKVDFGKGEKASTPVDWAFLINGTLAFFVEAKAAGAILKKYAEQLGMYFVKGQPHVKLGVYTNGLQWQFYTDLDTRHIMDKEPFLTWDVLEDAIPLAFLTILQRSQFNPANVRTFAATVKDQRRLMDVLNILLEPSPQFIEMAVKNPDRPIETGRLTQGRIEAWKPILRSAIEEWAKQCTLDKAINQGGSEGTGGGGSQHVFGRTYWESEASKGTLHTTDDLFKLVEEVQPKAKLNYTKYYIGLAIDGATHNFVAFKPQKASVIVRLKLPQGKEVDDQLKEGDFSTLPYHSQFGYLLKLGSVVNDKQRAVLLRLIRQAWEAFGRP